MAYIKSINHIAIVVDDIESALGFWRDALGLRLSHVEDVPSEQSVVAFLPLHDSEVELVKPTSDDTGVARYLANRGPGLHHICFEVDRIEEMLLDLKSKGVRLINETPITGTGGKKIAFIHPDDTHGVLVELYELTSLEPMIRIERARTLADRVLLEGQTVAAAALEFLRGLRPRDGPGDGAEN
ncbi:MAG TPA: methylmalonyl-CoA epimerase [Anaerolineales bacterium]|jgi:methylmalonyl-CoA/ethylmalonyl-CoA epimerase|nr:methylmalonyl-CoA epimerase [Anaerolineales bacterium]